VSQTPIERYIGLDAHATSCTVAVISQADRRLKDFPVETNGQSLVEAIRMIRGRKHLVFEEGLESAWLYETLRPHVDEVVVAGVTESRCQKCDQRDAYGLAEKLRTGSLDKRIFKAPSGSGRFEPSDSCRSWSPRIASAPSGSSGATAGSGP